MDAGSNPATRTQAAHRSWVTPTCRPRPIRRARPVCGVRPAWATAVLLVTGAGGLSGQSPLAIPKAPSPLWEAALAESPPDLIPAAGSGAVSPAFPFVSIGSRGPVTGGSTLSTGSAGAVAQLLAPSISPTRALLYSAVLPGWGQQRLERSRWFGFMAVEVIGWGFLWERQRTGHDFRARYRDLAWFVARRGAAVERMDGDFEYYEALGKYGASGAFDVDPYMGGVQPETDTTTYNGDIWSLANEIFLVPRAEGVPGPGSPEYEQAMAYYTSRSISPDFYWDWNDDDVNRAEYDRLIRRSDAALRQVTTVVGVILANHLVAAFDAFITARLRAADSNAVVRLFAAPEARGRWWLGGQLLP